MKWVYSCVCVCVCLSDKRHHFWCTLPPPLVSLTSEGRLERRQLQAVLQPHNSVHSKRHYWRASFYNPNSLCAMRTVMPSPVCCRHRGSPYITAGETADATARVEGERWARDDRWHSGTLQQQMNLRSGKRPLVISSSALAHPPPTHTEKKNDFSP